MAEIHITKLAAARRQLQAAIRMFFAQEDELAVHTVASAAYRLISDLKRGRGRDEVEDYFLTAVFYVVRDYRRGTLPKHFVDNAEMMKYVREWADALPGITENSKFESIRLSVSPDVKKSFWQSRNKVFNFLKHADNDAGRYISLDEVDNFYLLMQALGSYIDLAGDLGTEGYVLWLYSHVHGGVAEPLPEDLPGDVACLPSNERLPLFCAFLRELREERGET